MSEELTYGEAFAAAEENGQDTETCRSCARPLIDSAAGDAFWNRGHCVWTDGAFLYCAEDAPDGALMVEQPRSPRPESGTTSYLGSYADVVCRICGYAPDDPDALFCEELDMYLCGPCEDVAVLLARGADVEHFRAPKLHGLRAGDVLIRRDV